MNQGNKKVPGVTNPCQFSPCDFTEFIYDCREPFVDVIRGQFDKVPNNKFVGGRMSQETLDQIIAGYATTYASAQKLFTQPNLDDEAMTELNLRPVHVIALGLPEKFARPTDKEWSEYESNNPTWTKKSLKAFFKSVTGTSSAEASNQGYNMALYTEAVVNNEDSSSDTGYRPHHEASAVNEHGYSNRYREDVLLYTSNNSDLKAARRTGGPDPSLMLVGAVECKDDVNCSVRGIFQAAGCATPGVVRNVEYGHGSPVYLLCLGSTKLLYGVLVVDGVVQIRQKGAGNCIRAIDYDEYLASCAVTGTGFVLSVEELNAKLGAGLRKLRLNCADEDCKFPVKKYVLGRLHVPESNDHCLMLPSCLEVNGLTSPGARVFTEGLMRLIIGDSVLNWTPDKAKFAMLIRDAINHAASRKGGANMQLTAKDSWWYVEASGRPKDQVGQYLKMALAASIQQASKLFGVLPQDLTKELLVLPGGQANSGINYSVPAVASSGTEAELRSVVASGTSGRTTEVKLEPVENALRNSRRTAEVKAEPVENVKTEAGAATSTPKKAAGKRKKVVVPQTNRNTRSKVRMAASSAQQ